MTAWERFQGAALTLAGSGSIKDRLAEAYRNHLAYVAEDELPKEIREQFREVRCTLRRERPLLRGEDEVKATIRKMSSLEAESVATSVVRMFGALPRGSSSGARTAAPVPSQVIPLHIAEG